MSSVMHFDTPFSFQKSVHILSTLSRRLAKEKQYELLEAIDQRNWEFVVDFNIDYNSYPLEEWQEVKASRQILAFFQKNASIPLQVDRAAVAYAKFLESEVRCREVNDRFRSLRGVPLSKGGLRAGLIMRVQHKIAEILGDVPDPTTYRFGFGPGANVGVTRLTSVRRKLSAHPTLTTKAALEWYQLLRAEFPHWTQLEKAVIKHVGKLTFVPKNAKTDRVIVVEPVVNTFLQKGVGDYIRSRLRLYGVDLNDQGHNQRGALIGSRTDSLATIDLSSASDSISQEVVADVLPYDWYLVLDSLRTPCVRAPNGDTHWLEKFSSMGNGFTFELESLIFFAICKVIVGNRRVLVYGDDIVIPSDKYAEVTEALEFFGFSVNLNKSFASGPFRESCGKDYFAGVDVRPCYVKGLLSIKELFRLHNFFIRECDEETADIVLRFIPKRFRIFGPDGFGDGHLVGVHSIKRSKRKRGWGGYTFRTFSSKPFTRVDPCVGDYAAFLLLSSGASEPPPLGRQSLREYALRCRGIRDVVPSVSMYQERSKVVRYRLTSIYTLG